MNVTPEQLQQEFLQTIDSFVQKNEFDAVSKLRKLTDKQDRNALARREVKQTIADIRSRIISTSERLCDLKSHGAVARMTRLVNVGLARPDDLTNMPQQIGYLEECLQSLRTQMEEEKKKSSNLESLRLHYVLKKGVLRTWLTCENTGRKIRFRRFETQFREKLANVRESYLMRYRRDLGYALSAVDEFAAHTLNVANFTSNDQLPFRNFVANGGANLAAPGAFPVCLGFFDAEGKDELCAPTCTLISTDDVFYRRRRQDDMICSKCSAARYRLVLDFYPDCGHLCSACSFYLGLARQCRRCYWVTCDRVGPRWRFPLGPNYLSCKGKNADGSPACDFSRPGFE